MIPGDLTDRELVQLANQGDAAAFEILYRRHREWVVSLAWRFTGSRDDALDVMQEVFVQLFGRFPGFELTSTLRAYLYPVVKHRCISLLRKRRKVVPLAEDKHKDHGLAWLPEPPGEFKRLVSALSPDQQEMVQLRFGLGMQLSEIAGALDLPLGTVKSQLHKCLKLLRKHHKKGER